MNTITREQFLELIQRYELTHRGYEVTEKDYPPTITLAEENTKQE